MNVELSRRAARCLCHEIFYSLTRREKRNFAEAVEAASEIDDLPEKWRGMMEEAESDA